jgi:ectoine hydroxylase-related dioxygenase (phytanoyl-CoA dioxygenase family)
MLHLLETQGYVVIPNFLDSKNIDMLKNDNLSQGRQEAITNRNWNYVSNSALAELAPLINNTLSLVKEHTKLDVDLIMPNSMYLDNQVSPFDKYHQDFEVYYILQQNVNKLNFWIPIVKPNSNKSGLGIIPMDKLISLAPDYKNKIVNNGATHYFVEGTTTRVENYNLGESYQLQMNLDDIAVYPEIRAGDLLLMRGDTIHKTQDTDTNRLSVSVRCTQGSAKINKNIFLSGCERKQKFLKGMPKVVNTMLKLFEESNSDETTAYEFYKELQN